MQVRDGEPGDVAVVSAVFRRAWLHAYEDVLPYGELTRWDEEGAVALWTAVVADADRRVLVGVTADGVVRGFVVVRVMGTEGEVLALYVDPPAQGAGVGRFLHDAAVAALRDAGAAAATVWIVEGNAHALAFAQQLGWTPDGGPRQDEGWPAPSVRRRRSPL